MARINTYGGFFMAAYLVCNITSGLVIKGGHTDEFNIPNMAGIDEIAFAIPEETFAYPELNLVPFRAERHSNVDQQAGNIRSMYITTSPGQESTYIYKAQEAKAWVIGSNPLDFPFLNAESTATGVTIDDMAATVLATLNAWIALGSKIEGARMGAKKAITNATTALEIYQASVIDWNTVLSA